MAFIFSTSHLPESLVRRPDHLEDEEEAKRKVKSMEQIFWLNCNTAFKTMADTYNALHLSASIRKYDGGSGKEW